MDLFDLAEQLRSKEGAAGFSAVSQVDDYERCEFEYWNDAHCPDFADQLPETLTDPESGKTVYISQSLIKELRRISMQQLCPKRFYHVYVAGSHTEHDTANDARHAGRRFEFELTGALDYNGKIPDRLTTSKLQDSADQRRITANVAFAKNTLDRLEVPEKYATQYPLKYKCLRGSADIFYRFPAMGVGIDDIKYSGLLGDNNKFSPLSWRIDKIGEQFAHICQAAHYSLIALLAGHEEVRFRFIVFDSRPKKEGRYQCFEMRLSERIMNQHKNLILLVIDEMQNRFNGEGFSAVPSYSNCEQCPVMQDCPEYVDYPEVYRIEV